MPLPNFLQRFRRQAASAADVPPLSSQDVEVMRARARRRLIGMVVLVGAGVVGFPWLFETQPRPMSGDVQIVQAGSADGADVQIAATSPARGARTVAGRVAVSDIVAPSRAESTEPAPSAVSEAASVSREPDRAAPAPSASKAEAPRPAPAPKPVAASRPAPPAAATKVQEKKSVEKPADKPAAKPVAKPVAKDKAPEKGHDKAGDKAGDKASDKSADKDKSTTRYVVQFGAFADANTAHEARMKVERLGIKTYTQQVDTPAGKRIRVRMGPYADKAEADKVLSNLKKAGLSGAVLTL